MTDRTRSTIAIAAPPSAVMQVIADFEAYPQWIAFIKQVEVLETGPDGRAAVVRFVLDAGVVVDDYALKYTWSDAEVSWHLMRGTSIKAMDGSYRLHGTESSTDVSYELSIDVAVPLLAAFKRKAEQILVDTALRALKTRVEA